MAETKEIIIERVFNATVEKVWQAWTNPDYISKWWGPKDFTAPTIKNDFRVGGKYLYCMRGPAGTEFDKDFWSTGTYKEIVPLKKIVTTDSFADENGNVVPSSYYGMEGIPLELLVTVLFEELDEGKTKLTLRHSGFPAGEHADNAGEGWRESLEKLARVVSEV